MKYLLSIIFIGFLNIKSSAQKPIKHHINVEFAIPSLIHEYPSKSKICKFGYSFIKSQKIFKYGFSSGINYNYFRILPPNGNSEEWLDIKSYGIFLGAFIRKNISRNIDLSIFSDIGSYSTTFELSVNGNLIPKSGLISYGLGIKFDIKIDNFYIYLKVPYERYQDAKSIFHKNTFGYLFYERLGNDPILLNGINPSIGIEYSLFNKSK